MSTVIRDQRTRSSARRTFTRGAASHGNDSSKDLLRAGDRVRLNHGLAHPERGAAATGQVDLKAGEVRLEPETTNNRDGRIFYLTDDLRALVERQCADHEALKKTGVIVPWVFFRLVAKGRGGKKEPRRILAFTKAWKTATIEADCPGRIPHDLRRTAVRT